MGVNWDNVEGTTDVCLGYVGILAKEHDDVSSVIQCSSQNFL
jgi:hypothetical protein